jgi:hypothetical protein
VPSAVVALAMRVHRQVVAHPPSEWRIRRRIPGIISWNATTKMESPDISGCSRGPGCSGFYTIQGLHSHFLGCKGLSSSSHSGSASVAGASLSSGRGFGTLPGAKVLIRGIAYANAEGLTPGVARADTKVLTSGVACDCTGGSLLGLACVVFVDFPTIWPTSAFLRSGRRWVDNR